MNKKIILWSKTVGFVRSFIFGFFAAMMELQLLFVWQLMPETKV